MSERQLGREDRLLAVLQLATDSISDLLLLTTDVRARGTLFNKCLSVPCHGP